MTLAQQQHLDIGAPRVEPAEREDPRNALLDEIAAQIIAGLDAAARNEVLEPLLRRIEAEAPALAKRLAVLSPAAAAASGGTHASGMTTLQPRGPDAPLPSPQPAGGTEAELRLAKVLAALKLGKPKTEAARELLDGAKMIVLSDLAALRAARSVLSSRGAAGEAGSGAKGARRVAPALSTTEVEVEQASLGLRPFTFIVDDEGSGQ